MKFNNHHYLEGLHAPFSASSPAWLRYDPERVVTVYNSLKKKELGTRYHAWAKETIDLRIRQPKSNRTLCAYVNDAIGFRMQTEVLLYYSEHFFGTADAISYDEVKKFLRIHDLKTGVTKVHIEQLYVYAALFCLEYHVNPFDLHYELRIYQNDSILIDNPDPSIIDAVMNVIKSHDQILSNIDKEEG